MALAVKNAMEATPQPQSFLDRLALSSLVGLAYVLGGLAVVFYALPWLWSVAFAQAPIINAFVTGALLIVVMLAAAAALIYGGLRLVNFEPTHGLRAGIFVAAAGLAGILAVTWCIGRILEAILSRWEGTAVVGAALTIAVAVGLTFLALRWFLQPQTEDFLTAFEDQGWFGFGAYKKSQGQRVRRGTILGLLVLAGTGIWSLISHNTLVYNIEGGNPWLVSIPFSGGEHLALLRDVRFTVPLLLAAASLWLSYRLVNFPTFADFLIATEAELNKVSWTTRKRLWQDTIVVLVTVIMFTLFLFVVDIAWGFLLSKVGVIRTDAPAGQQIERNPQAQPW
jgi:preprotein translocase SecE subunit